MFKDDLMNSDSLVCVMDFSSNIRTKHIRNTQSMGFVYDQWTLFNLTVLRTGEKEDVEKYFDVFTFLNHRKERLSKHNSDYVISALKRIFQHSLFEDKKRKNLSLWSDNGLALKNTKVVHYLASLSGTRFTSSSYKFFVEYHGKSICDRHFGNVARARYNYEEELTSTVDLRKALSSLKNTELIEIYENDVEKLESQKTIKGIKNLYKMENIRKEGELIIFDGATNNDEEEEGPPKKTPRNKGSSEKIFRKKRGKEKPYGSEKREN